MCFLNRKINGEVHGIINDKKILIKLKMYLDYLIKKPDFIDYKKNNNVIFLLHGYGSNEVDLFNFKDLFDENEFIISLRAPIKLFDNGFGWFNLNLENNDG